jgi:hypothetical protein
MAGLADNEHEVKESKDKLGQARCLCFELETGILPVYN